MTHTIIQKISNAGYDINSYHECARKVNAEYADRALTRKQSYKLMDEMFGSHIEVDHDRAANVALRYMITEAVRMNADGFLVHLDDLLRIGKSKTVEFFSRFQWLNPSFKGEIQDIPTAIELVDVAVEDIIVTRTNVAGKVVKPRKGLKQEAAAKIYEANHEKSNQEIIALFVNQLDMSKAGATTYLYNMKKANGAIVEGAKRGRKPKVVS
jgi:hypothetical protein